MLNKDFLKTLNVLYVEDDVSIRTSLGNILKKIFNEVIICEDGQIGVDKYKEYTSKIEFDIIISDINMPNLDGLAMVKQIRELNDDIPVIMATAHGEANYLMEAIKVNVSGYSLKPIDAKKLLTNVEKFCQIKKNQKLIIQKEVELSEYMDLINTISPIIKVDNDDKITYANEFFQDISLYTQEELLNKQLSDIIHPDSKVKNYAELNAHIKSDKTWKGKLKFLSQEDEKFHLRTTAIPQKNSDTGLIDGYISIGFLADDEEQERTQTLQQVKVNIMEQKQKVLSLTRKIKELSKFSNQSPLSVSLEKNEKILKKILKDERIKNSDLGKQVQYYEDEILTLKAKLSGIIDNEKDKRAALVSKVQSISKENDHLKGNLITAQNQINALKPKPKFVE